MDIAQVDSHLERVSLNGLLVLNTYAYLVLGTLTVEVYSTLSL